jgi:hypothetical protein
MKRRRSSDKRSYTNSRKFYDNKVFYRRRKIGEFALKFTEWKLTTVRKKLLFSPIALTSVVNWYKMRKFWKKNQ